MSKAIGRQPEKKVTISVCVSRSVRDGLAAIAKKTDRSISYVADSLLAQGIKKAGSLEP